MNKMHVPQVTPYFRQKLFELEATDCFSNNHSYEYKPRRKNAMLPSSYTVRLAAH